MSQQAIRQRLEDHWTNITDILSLEDSVKGFVCFLAEIIARFDNILATAPQEFRALLRKGSSDADGLIEVARALNQFPEVRDLVNIRETVETLARFRDQINAMKMMLPEGGRPEARLNQSRKILTANWAFIYMANFTAPANLTGHRDGIYVKFSNILFEVATGQERPDLYDECCEVVDTWRQFSRRQD
jgi:hypothetical protein